jgi:hypothetical protein
MSVSIGPPSYVSDNLVLFLDAGNPASYPGYGSDWFDITPNRLKPGNVATLGGNNPPTYSPEDGGFIFVDNSSDPGPVGPTGYIWPSIDTSLFSGTTLTFDLWVRPYSSGPIGDQPLLTVGIRYWVALTNIETSSPRLSFGVASVTPGGGFGCSYDTSNLGAWQNFVFVINADGTADPIPQNKIYINGVSQSLTANGWPPYPTGVEQYANWADNFRFILGYRNNSGTRIPPSDQRKSKFDISVFRVYSGELTQDQIEQNFNSLRGRYGI